MNEVSARAWSELLHAEVAFLLRGAGIPTLHIKGPTVALWLFDEGERVWGDVDILVPPSRLEDALATLQAAGFTERYPGVNRRTTTDHAITLVHNPPGDLGSAGAEVDIHDRFEGIDADPEWAFEQLWRRREPEQLAHVDVWFPDIATRALLIALNTARSDTPKAREDLARMIRTGEPEDWDEVVWLAGRVQALPALRAGLEIDPAGSGRCRNRWTGSRARVAGMGAAGFGSSSHRSATRGAGAAPVAQPTPGPRPMAFPLPGHHPDEGPCGSRERLPADRWLPPATARRASRQRYHRSGRCSESAATPAMSVRERQESPAGALTPRRTADQLRLVPADVASNALLPEACCSAHRPAWWLPRRHTRSSRSAHHKICWG